MAKQIENKTVGAFCHRRQAAGWTFHSRLGPDLGIYNRQILRTSKSLVQLTLTQCNTAYEMRQRELYFRSGVGQIAFFLL